MKKTNAHRIILSAVLLQSIVYACLPAYAVSDNGVEMVFQTGNNSEVSCLAVNRDSTLLFSGSSTGDVAIWDMKSGRQIRSVEVRTDYDYGVRDLQIEPDNRTLRVFCGNRLCFVDSRTGIVEKTFKARSGELCVFLKNGKTVLSRKGNRLYIEDIESDGPARVLYEHQEPIMSVFSSGVNRLIVFRDYRGCCYVLDTSTGKTTVQLNFTSDESIDQGAISPDGRYALLSGRKSSYIVSLCDGKTVQVAALRTGRSPRIHSPSELAFSPDGKTVFFASGVRYDIVSGKTADGFTVGYDRIAACSPDGRFVVYASDPKGSVAGSRSSVLSVYDAASTELVREMTGNSVTAQDSCSVTPDGKYLISGGGSENFVRVWDLKSAMLAFRLQTGDLMGGCDIRMAPDGKKFSVMKTGILYCFSTEDWRLILKEPFGREARHAWFPDSERIAVARSSGLKGNAVEIFSVGTGKREKLFDGDFPVASDIAVSPDGDTVAVAEYPVNSSSLSAVRLIRSSDGKTVKSLTGEKLGFARIAFSDDGRKIIGEREHLRVWNVPDGSFHDLPGNGRLFMKIPGGGLCLIANGISIQDPSTGSLSQTAIDPAFAKENLALAGFGYHHPTAPVVFYTCHDGGIRMINYRTGKMTVFCGNKTNGDWLVFNRSGYWDASGGGASLIAARKGNDVYAIDQFAIKYNRPDLVISEMPGADSATTDYFASEYIRRCRRMGIDPSSAADMGSLPSIRDLKVTRGGRTATVKFSIDRNGTAVSRYNVFVNGVPVFGDGGKIAASSAVTENIQLITGMNRIEVSCFTSGGAESIRAAATEQLDERIAGNVYFIGFGVSAYKNESLRLKYADKDIRDLSAALRSAYGSARYRALVLTNEDVTADAADKAREFLSSARPEDSVILAIAGHGVHDSDKAATYYFLTHETELDNLPSTAMNFEKIESILQGIAPRTKLFLMDTCESGELEPSVEAGYFEKARSRGITARTARAISVTGKKGASNRAAFLRSDRFIHNDLLRRSGAIVFSSCKGNEFSYEQESITNGCFTRSIIDALSGNADADRNRSISISELKKYVEDDVARRTGNLQHPTVDRDNINMPISFPLFRP